MATSNCFCRRATCALCSLRSSPKSWALAHPDRSATRTAPLVSLVKIAPLRWVANGVVRLVGADLPNGFTDGEVSEEELLAFAEEAAASDAINEDERHLIEQVIEFGDTVTHEVMIPRPDIIAVNEHASIEEAIDLVIGKGFSRLPVFQDNIDDIVGIVYSKELMRALRDGDKSQM